MEEGAVLCVATGPALPPGPLGPAVRPPCHAGARARGSGRHRPRRRLSLLPAVPAALSPADGHPLLAAWLAWQVLVGEVGPGSADSASPGATAGVQGRASAQQFLLKPHARVLPRTPAHRPQPSPAPLGELSFCRWEGTSSWP